MNKKTFAAIAAKVIVACGLLVAASAASAGGVNWSVSIGVPPPPVVYYYPPTPVYVQPPPAYVQPHPTYIQPQPVYVAPTVVPGPVYYYDGPRYRLHRRHHHH